MREKLWFYRRCDVKCGSGEGERVVWCEVVKFEQTCSGSTECLAEGLNEGSGKGTGVRTDREAGTGERRDRGRRTREGEGEASECEGERVKLGQASAGKLEGE